MMGKNHITVNFAVAAAYLTTASAGLSDPDPMSLGRRWGTAALSALVPEQVSMYGDNGLAYQAIMFLFAAACMLWAGSLLPDIDQRSSRVGRALRLPFKHRTWTHTVWFMLPIAFLAWCHPWFRFLLLGCALHVAGDAVSAAGVCPFYPIQKYRRYPNGAFVARNHVIKLYRTERGSLSERRFVLIVIAACVLTCVFFKSGVIEFVKWIYY